MTATLASANEAVDDAAARPVAARRADDGRVLRWSARAGLVVSLIVWLVSLRGMRGVAVSQYGLLAARPLLLLSALGVTLAFVLFVRIGALRDAVAALLAMVAVTRATASIAAPLPIYEWTYKHIGVADHLSSTGHLARGVDIYNSWPGFFSAAAWFGNVTGVSFVDTARWFPIVADVATALGMYAVSRSYGHTRRIALVAAFGMQVFNWVAQDYYSPQAISFILALAVIALLLHSRRSPRAVWFSLPLFLAITVTHQLTPFWLAGIATILGLTKRVQPRTVAIVYLALAIAFAAVNFNLISGYGLLTGFDPLSNAQSNVPTAGNAGRAFTSLAARGGSALMWLAAAGCLVLGWRRNRPVWIPAVLAFTSFGLLAGQSYGGEAIFRVFLYSIPGCVLLIAPVVERTVVGRPIGSAHHRLRLTVRRVVLAVLAVAAVSTSMQAYYGTWFINIVDRQGLDAERHLLATAPSNSLIVPLSLGIAERPTGRYVLFATNDDQYDSALVLRPGVVSSRFTPAEVIKLTRSFQQTDRPVYLIISEQMRRYITYYGLFPPGAVSRLTEALSRSSSWRTVENTPTLSIFRLTGS